MYKPILSGQKGFGVAIILLAAFFIIIYANYSYGATFKSEEELLEETRLAVEKYLDESEKKVEAPAVIRDTAFAAEEEKPVVTDARAAEIAEDPIAADEKTAAVEEGASLKVEAPAAIEEAPVAMQEKKAVAEEPPVIAQEEKAAAEEKPAAIKESQKSEEWKPAVLTEEKPTVAIEKKPVEKKTAEEEPVEEIPSDVTSVMAPEESKSQSVAEEINYSVKQKKAILTEAVKEPVLKKMDVNKIGASPYYDTYEGLRLLKYFTVAQRVEIYQEPRPVDSYILDALSMRTLYANTPWNIKSDFRTQITPLFTRAYGTEFTISDPKNKEGQIRYTHDYREIYRNYYPKYPNIKREMWDQNEVLFMHAKVLDPIGWFYASNLGYRYSTMDDKDTQAGNKSYYEVRHTYFASLSLAPTDKFEWFGQAEYYKSMHLKATYDYRPDHFLGRTEIRIKSNDMKTLYVPSFSYSKDYYYPFANSYQKYEIQYRVGRDFTKRFSAASTFKFVMGLRDEPDNTAPTYASKNPFKDKAYATTWENRFSYNVYDRLYLQAGLDLSNGLNMNEFDNYGLLAGLEYYAPGIIRVDFGWRGNHYYNIDDFLSTLYFKFYLFM